MTLEFPAEHPDLDAFRPDERAPAPTLMPSPPPEPPPVVPVTQEQRRSGKAAAMVLGAVASVATVVVVLVAALQGGTSPAASDERGQLTTDAASTTTTTTNPVPTDENSAQQMLADQVANDRPQAEALVGYWVPQLSSKRLGLEANGIVYDHLAIWADFANLRAQYPGALLLWSGDYTSFKLPDFWVTIVPQSHGSGEAANGWCDSAGIGRDDCFAKLITHTGSYAGSTLHR